LRRTLIFAVGCTLCLTLTILAPGARANAITVQNASFEITNPLVDPCPGGGCAFNYGPIPGWTITGTAGSWQPGPGYYDVSMIDGSTVAFISIGTISQDLGIGLNPNSTYALSVSVGQRIDELPPFTSYSIGLFAGNTALQVLDGSNSAITPGTFNTETLSYTTGDTVTPGDLSIVLTSTGYQTSFDNVSLVDPPAPTPTPEPSSLAMLGAGLMGIALLGLLAKTRFVPFGTVASK
jgi:hypothetical protein